MAAIPEIFGEAIEENGVHADILLPRGGPIRHQKAPAPEQSDDEDGWVVGDQIDLPDDDEPEGQPFRYAWQNRGQAGTSQTGLPLYRWHDPDTHQSRTQHAEPGTGRETRKKQTEESRSKKEQEQEAAKKAPARLVTPPEKLAGVMDAIFPGGWAGPEAVPAMVGAPTGAEVVAHGQTHGPTSYAGKYENNILSVGISVYHPAIQTMSRTLKMGHDGSLMMCNSMFFLKKKHRGGGLGLQVFSDEVKACALAGVDHIKTCAGKGGIMNGYYTWPRLGYDANIQGDWLDRLRRRTPGMVNALVKTGVPAEEAPARLKALADSNPKTVLDLMETEDGRRLWKAKGYMETMKFDLAPGSRSLKVLNAYLASKGKQPVEVSPEVAKENEGRKQERKKSAEAIMAREMQANEAAKQANAEAAAEAAKQDAETESMWIAHAEARGLNPTEYIAAARSAWVETGDYKKALASALRGMTENRHHDRFRSPENQELIASLQADGEKQGLVPQALLARAYSIPVPEADPQAAIKRAFRLATIEIEQSVQEINAVYASLGVAVRQRAHELYDAEIRTHQANPETHWGPSQQQHVLQWAYEAAKRERRMQLEASRK